VRRQAQIGEDTGANLRRRRGRRQRCLKVSVSKGVLTPSVLQPAESMLDLGQPICGTTGRSRLQADQGAGVVAHDHLHVGDVEHAPRPVGMPERDGRPQVGEGLGVGEHRPRLTSSLGIGESRRAVWPASWRCRACAADDFSVSAARACSRRRRARLVSS
jgi:hypothetical protein